MTVRINMCAGADLACAGNPKACAGYWQEYAVYRQLSLTATLGRPMIQFNFTDEAREKSTCIVNIKFFDEKLDAVVPNSITWKLTDDSGSVINSRSAESETPGSDIDIVLSGLDLEIIASNKSRVLLVQAPYDSSHGNGLPNNEECQFEIKELLNIS